MEELTVIYGFDVTPEIHYRNGKAVKIVKKCVYNQNDVGESEYCLTDGGKYTQWHFDPEHGGPLIPQPIEKSRLEELSKHNPHTIPCDLILGLGKKDIEKILTERKIEAVKHIDS
ncbi:MAG: hypothetical protein AABW50_03660 [Nanoarchaeota archaeon]